MDAGGIVLCGGQSRRMGRPKAWLPFGDETLLARLVRLLGEVVQPIVVVAAAGQELPRLARHVIVARDREPDGGPLVGLYTGLVTLTNLVPVAFAIGCDTPLLNPALVRHLLTLATGYDAVIPQTDARLHPLTAVYRPRVAPVIRELLAEHVRRPIALYQRVPTLEVDAVQLRAVDPELRSLLNVNSPADYRQALALAGLDGETEG